MQNNLQCSTCNINARAKDISIRLPDVQWLGDGERSSVAGESGLAGGDELNELFRSAPTIECCLVADDGKIDNVPVLEGLKSGNLTLSTSNASVVNINAQYQSKSVFLCCISNVLEAVTIT